jgi:predicted tellurium resistance membrane protein TerC
MVQIRLSRIQQRNIGWVVVWVGLGLALGVAVLVLRGARAAAEYYAAYFVEESLSVDDIFVFVIIFSELHIRAEYQRRVLGFGIAGALLLRGIMILGGIAQ